jgi:hypothetical protein
MTGWDRPVSASPARTGKLCTIAVKHKSAKATKENKATVFLFTGVTSLSAGMASTRNQRFPDVAYGSEAFTKGSSRKANLCYGLLVPLRASN